MAQVVSFVDYTPAARYDDTPWTTAVIEEASSAAGPWSEIETITLAPVDADPSRPMARSLTTNSASDEQGLWYRIKWSDGTASSPTMAVQNVAAEVLGASALCTDEDVRLYLGISAGELSEDDRNTIIRLVNAASQTFSDESQRIWRASAGVRLYRMDAFDLSVGRIRIDDATSINSVAYGDYNNGDAPTEISGYAPWQEEPGYPISAIVFADTSVMASGNVITVDAEWGWPAVPAKVRQAVIYTAAEWYARDVEKFSATISLDQERILMPQVLPSQVQREAESYRRWRVA